MTHIRFTYPYRTTLARQMMLFCRIYPLERPRLMGSRVFQPQRNQPLLAELRPYTEGIEAMKEPVVVDITIVFKGTGKHPTAPKWGDEDNLRKSVNDCLVAAGILQDDRWVIGGETWKLFGTEDQCLIEIWKAK